MSVEENLSINQRYWEARNQVDLVTLDELVAEQYTDNVSTNTPGREGLKERLRYMRHAFPDLQVTLEDVIAAGDKVVVRTTWRGTHRGEFGNAAPTNSCTVAFAARHCRSSSGHRYS